MMITFHTLSHPSTISQNQINIYISITSWMSQICTWSFCTISSEDNDLHIDPQHPACDDWYDGMFSLYMWYLFYSNMHLTVNIIYIYWTVTMWNFWMLHMICFCICFIHNIYMQISASYKIWVQILMHRIEMIPNDKWLHNLLCTMN